VSRAPTGTDLGRTLASLLAMARFSNQGLDHVAIGVADVDRSAGFYREVVGLERAHDAWDVPVVMAAQGSGVAIFPQDMHPGSGDPGAIPPIRILHIAFRVDREGLEAARGELDGRGIETRLSDHGIAHSIYFDDPDGHRLELTTYEV
jgi:catechol 2,3-dioxygenase-like lactoylglutathione lyase family enzyme